MCVAVSGQHQTNQLITSYEENRVMAKLKYKNTLQAIKIKPFNFNTNKINTLHLFRPNEIQPQ